MKMILARFRNPNFGDELNAWIWPRLLPGFFDGDESALFLGIGSILSRKYDGAARKIVCGAGFVAEYTRPPDLSGDDWRFYFVRGPRTTATLGLDPRLAVGDGAILIRSLIDPAGERGDAVSFMPHWESLDWGYWDRACAQAGVRLIDPRLPVSEVLDEIVGSRLMICEAMHGAIVADALRIPWVPILPLEPRHRAKWLDWSEALGLAYEPRRIPPSSLVELVPRLTRNQGALRASRDAMNTWPMTPARAATIRLAAHGLRQAALSPGLLSADARMRDATDRMLEALDRLKRDWREGRL